MKQLTVYFLLLSALFLGITDIGQAQEQPGESYSFEFRGEELPVVLDRIARETGMDLIYDPELVKGFNIYTRIRNRQAPELLQAVLEHNNLDYIILSSGTIVIVSKVAEEPQYGSFAGKVVDSRTGEPLPSATVMLADASGGASTNRAGMFTMNGLVTGTYNIIFSYVGYEPVYKTIDVKPDEQTRDQIELNPEPVNIAPLVVKGHLPRLPGGHSTGKTIRPDSPWEPAGVMRDAIRSLNLFSGVQHGLAITDLRLQGSQKGEHRMMLDGVPVYNPYSFGQMFSAFSPYAIGRVHVHKAGYGVGEGSQIAGLINLKHDFPGSDRYALTTQGDPLSLNARADMNFQLTEESPLKVMTAFRSNYWSIYRNPALESTLRKWDEVDPLTMNLILDGHDNPMGYNTLEHDTDVRFHDVHIASRFDINEYNSLSASVYSGENFVSTDLLGQAIQTDSEPSYVYARDQYMWNNFMGRMTHDWAATPRLDLTTQVSFSENTLDHRYLIGSSDSPIFPDVDGTRTSVAFDVLSEAGDANRLPSQNNENSIRHLILRSDAGYSISPRFSLETGLQFDYVSSKVNLSDLFFLPALSDQQSAILSTYLDGEYKTGQYWKFNAGSRITYSRSADRAYIEPRAGVQYDRPDSDLGYWSVKVAGGLYRQFINQYEITNAGPTALVPSFTIWSHAGNIDIPKAYHLSGSLLFEPATHTSITVEAFHKWQPATTITSYNNLMTGFSINRTESEAFAESTSMRAYGAGIRLDREFSDVNLKLLAGYDYNISRINMESQFGRMLPAPWSEPHSIQARAMWNPFGNLTAVLKWQSIYGRSWGFRQAYYDFLLYRNGSFDFQEPEKDRLSPFHQLDLSLIYKPDLGVTDMELRLDLINLLNRQNVIDWSLQPSGTGDRYQIRKRTMPGFNPSLSVQFHF